MGRGILPSITGAIGNQPGVWQVRRLAADGKDTYRAKEKGGHRFGRTWIGTTLRAVHRKWGRGDVLYSF
jgi:hypothetical protein